MEMTKTVQDLKMEFKKRISNTEEDLSFNEDEVETLNTLTRKVKG